MAEFDYEIIRSSRKTLSLQITPEGKILARCPYRMPAARIEAFIQEKQGWLRSHLEKISARPRQPRLTREELQALTAEAREAIPRRLAFFAPRVGVSYGRVTLRMQKTRWGSCSPTGNLNFNILLLLAPPEVLDYVVVHELCHRLEMNHSPAFWAQVERVLPDYRQRRKWLKDFGGGLILRGFGEGNT